MADRRTIGYVSAYPVVVASAEVYGTATGGTSSSITVSSQAYTLLAFTSDANLTVTTAGLFDFLLIAGGGGGGGASGVSHAGGGGGGGHGALQWREMKPRTQHRRAPGLTVDTSAQSCFLRPSKCFH